MVPVYCHNCESALQLSDDGAGKFVRCPECQSRLLVSIKKIGKYCHGWEYIKFFSRETYPNQQQSTMQMGNFCVIAPAVQVFLIANHRTDWITTFPFGSVSDKFGKSDRHEVVSKGDVILEHDVWIGFGATIMSGVTIGSGAVVAANSHVVSNVEPYTIVGGNPATFIKKRFSDEVIASLLKYQWWNLDDENIKEIVPLLCSNDFQQLFHELEKIK